MPQSTQTWPTGIGAVAAAGRGRAGRVDQPPQGVAVGAEAAAGQGGVVAGDAHGSFVPGDGGRSWPQRAQQAVARGVQHACRAAGRCRRSCMAGSARSRRRSRRAAGSSERTCRPRRRGQTTRDRAGVARDFRTRRCPRAGRRQRSQIASPWSVVGGDGLDLPAAAAGRRGGPMHGTASTFPRRRWRSAAGRCGHRRHMLDVRTWSSRPRRGLGQPAHDRWRSDVQHLRVAGQRIGEHGHRPAGGHRGVEDRGDPAGG